MRMSPLFRASICTKSNVCRGSAQEDNTDTPWLTAPVGVTTSCDVSTCHINKSGAIAVLSQGGVTVLKDLLDDVPMTNPAVTLYFSKDYFSYGMTASGYCATDGAYWPEDLFTTIDTKGIDKLSCYGLSYQ